MKPESASLLKIGELAKAAGESVSTIKFYVKEGLIQAACKTGPNMAYYHPDSVGRVQRIKALQKEHYYPLSVIKRMLESCPPSQNPMEIELLDAIHKADPAGSDRTYTLAEAARACRLSREQIHLLTKAGLVCPEADGKRTVYTDADLQILLLVSRRQDAGIPFAESVASFLCYERALRGAADADVDAFITQALLGVCPSARDAVRMIRVSDETLDAFIALKRKQLNRAFGSTRVNDLYRFSAHLAALIGETARALDEAGLSELAARCRGALNSRPDGDDALSAALGHYHRMVGGLSGDLAECVALIGRIHGFFLALEPGQSPNPDSLLLCTLRLGWLSFAPSLLACSAERDAAARDFAAFTHERIGSAAYSERIASSITRIGGTL